MRCAALHGALGRDSVIESGVGNEDFAGPAIVVGADDTACLELADEFGCTLIADVKAVAQHHGGDG